MTTKDIIKALPINDQLKMQLLNMFDFMTPTQHLTVEHIVWTTYDMLFSQKLHENLELEFAQALDGQAEFNKQFYARALKQTERQMNEEFQETMAKMDLAVARKAMEQIMNEIQAAKKPQHPS